MHEDRTLFGQGPYPDTGPLAVIARLALLGAIVAIVVAVFLPASLVPRFLRSHYLQHFAAFYVLMLTALAAIPRAGLGRIVIGVTIFATVLESSHLLSGAAFHPLLQNWVADLGGVSAAAGPVVVERFRKRFPQRS